MTLYKIISLDLQCNLVCFVYDLPNALLVNLTFQLLIISYFIIILYHTQTAVYNNVTAESRARTHALATIPWLCEHRVSLSVA